MKSNRNAHLTTLQRLLALVLLGGAMTALTACHTVEGAGKDIQDAGQAVEDVADDATDDDHN